MRSSSCRFSTVFALSLVLGAIAFLQGCATAGNGGGGNPPPQLIVGVTPSAQSVQTGNSQNFAAVVSNDPDDRGVTWALSGTGCSGASCGSLTNATVKGVTYTAPNTMPNPATVILTAASLSDERKTGVATITVTTAPNIVVTISPMAASVQAGVGTQNFTASLQNDSQNKGVTWSLSGTGCSGSSCGTLTGVTTTSATYVAPTNAPSPNTVVLTATSAADNTKTASATITVTGPISVFVSPGTASMNVNGTQNFAAAVSNDAQNKGVTWTLSGTGCSGTTCGTLTNVTTTSAMYTAPATIPSPATVTLTATSIADGTKTGVSTITVTSTPIIVVTVAPLTPQVQAGIGTQNFTATLQNDSQNKGVTWTLSGTGCSGATCGTLTNATTTGVTYTAPTSVPSPATVTLTATSIADGTKTGTGTITVTAAITVGVAPTTASVNVTKTQQFTATVTNDAQNKGVTWTLSGTGCSGATCGTISSSGLYTAPGAVPSPATVAATATSVADPTKKFSATITVLPAITVGVTPPTASVQVGLTQNFGVTVTNDSQNKGVTWTLSGTGCSGATCGTLTNVTTTSVTYTAPGGVPSPAAVTLTAMSISDNTKTGTSTITVTSAPVIVVTVAPLTPQVQAGIGTQNFTATVSNDAQNKGVTWSLSGSGCSGATCGSLSAVTTTTVTYTAPTSVPSPATVTLTATSIADGTKAGTGTITVTAAITVAVAPTTASVNVTKTQQFTATVTNDAQNKGVTWTLSGTGCSGATCGTLSATSSASGVAITYTAPATVLVPATVTLTAKSVADGTRTSPATITVLPAIAISVAPSTPSVLVNGTQNFTATVSNDAQNKGVTWSLSGSGCSGATCGSLSAVTTTTVTYTAPATAPSPATVTLTATSIADVTKTGLGTITVTTSSGPITVAIVPKHGELTVTQKLTVSATVSNDALNQGVTWSLSPSGGSFNPSSSASGANVTFTAPSSAGVYTMTATSVSDGTKTAAITIAVTDLVGVTTYHNDLSRDGANTKEYGLTTSNVNSTSFGKLFSCSADGAIYGQPLWVSNVNISGGIHNVIVAVTTHDSVYVFDADANPCVTYWHNQVIPSGETYLSSSDAHSTDIYPDVGIIGTPVIDPVARTIYVVSKTKTTPGTATYHQRLHALSLIDGSERTGSPVEIDSSITVPGNCEGGSTVAFNPLRENQRPGLALVNGVVYIAWASHGDTDIYHGWVIGYNAATLARSGVFNTSPNAAEGLSYCRAGIWMSGGAPAADSTNSLYFITGNGIYDGVTAFGDSFIRLNTTGALSVTDWFTPSNQMSLDAGDTDLGSGGSAIIVDQPSGPHPNLLIGAGKDGRLFVIDRTNMGHFNSGTNSVVQTLVPGGSSFSTPAFWNNALYYFGFSYYGQEVEFNQGTNLFNTSRTSETTTYFNFPGATPSVSASGNSNGIVWAIDTNAYGSTDTIRAAGPAILHSYDATNLAKELWNSTQGTGNTAGNAVKFTVPTIANGKVYIGTRGNDNTAGSGTIFGEIDVYGLLP